MVQTKPIQMNYVDLDIICDGLFILSCLGELDIHRKVSEEKKRTFDFEMNLSLGNIWF